MEFKDYYQILGVARDATADDIKKAFRQPPDWDVGFEFSGTGFPGGNAAGFSDFFSELFGTRMACCTREGTRFHARGEDHHAKVNTEEEQTLSARHGICSIPTLALFISGCEVARQAGAMGMADVVQWAHGCKLIRPAL